MKSESSFTKFAGIIAVISCPVALLSLYLIFAAFNWDFDTAFNPVKAIAFEPDPSTLLRWGWILDMFGYYLPLVPLALVLHRRFSSGNEMAAQMFTLSGIGFLFIGVTGAAMLASATQPLFEVYQTGGETEKLIATHIYANLNNEVASGIWNILAMLLAAIWWIGIGWLMRPHHKWLSIFTQVLGFACLLDILGYIFQVEALSATGLYYYLFVAPFWAAWAGFVMMKK